MDTDGRAGAFENVGAARNLLYTRGSENGGWNERIMNGMRTVVVHKIASITQACGLSHEIRISPDIPCEEGVVLVVEIQNSKANYNTLELTSGRMAKVSRGDIVVGALGHRKALFGYSGHIPTSLQPGDVVQMLNIGGVLGICDSATQDKGKPFDCKVLGTVVDIPLLRRAHRSSRPGGIQGARLRRGARRTRRACRRTGRHLHGGWQNRRSVGHHCAHASSRASSSMPSRPPASPCVATFSRSKIRGPAAR